LILGGASVHRCDAVLFSVPASQLAEKL